MPDNRHGLRFAFAVTPAIFPAVAASAALPPAYVPSLTPLDETAPLYASALVRMYLQYVAAIALFALGALFAFALPSLMG